MRLELSQKELAKRIELNRNRLATGDYYSFENIFSPPDYDWYGDKEGRALLAFVCHYAVSGEKISCMDSLTAAWDSHVNEKGFFGPDFSPAIHEQQLSGHSWVLRGLCEHYEQFGDEESLRRVGSIVSNLFLNRKGRFSEYPTHRGGDNSGGVSGSESAVIGDWILSSDVGCAFMALDGLSHAYKLLPSAELLSLLDEMFTAFCAIDKEGIQMQTHCALSAGRGMMRLYGLTANEKYLCGAKELFSLYETRGTTATCQNMNWWGRPNTWTEPCAIVDSVMLALTLYRATGNSTYRTFAAKAFHNGLATAQRPNGGAGTDTVVLPGACDTLRPDMPEAFFCCTMRLAEGLRFAHDNREELWAEVTGTVTKNGQIYSDGDIIYGQPNENALPFAENTVTVDGMTLCPIVKLYKTPEGIWQKTSQKILF